MVCNHNKLTSFFAVTSQICMVPKCVPTASRLPLVFQATEVTWFQQQFASTSQTLVTSLVLADHR